MLAFQWFYNLRVAHKLAALLLPCLVAFIGLGWWNNYANKVIDEINQQVDHVSKMRGDVMTSALIAQHYGSAVESRILDTSHAKREELKNILGSMSGVNAWATKLDNDLLVKSLNELVQQIELILGLQASAGQEVMEEATLLSDMAATFNQTLQTHIDNVSQYRLKLRNDLETWSIIVLVVGILLSATLGFWIARSLLKQLGGEPGVASNIAGRIAEGDLTVAIETKANDQSSLLFAIKRMSASLASIVGNVRDAAESISADTKEIAASNDNLSQRTEVQAASLEETASSMEELTSTVKQNADNAKQANQLAATAAGVAIKGGQVVNEVVRTMASISDSSKKIVDIISVIEGIAFQTNILALNAAVEAARAGEQGRGFAVVASEVRNLAQRSGVAAKEIKALIGDSVNNVLTGSKLVNQAGTTMEEIVSAVKGVSDIMSEIATASIEQSTGIEQVNQTVTQMDEMTQQNAALVEQAAASVASMQEQADILMEAVSIFKLEARGSTQRRVVARPALAHHTSTAVATVMRERKLVIPKVDKDSDWNEF